MLQFLVGGYRLHNATEIEAGQLKHHYFMVMRT